MIGGFTGRICVSGSDGKNDLPIIFHIDDTPTFRISFVKPFIEFTDGRFAIVGPLARGIGVMNVKAKVGSVASSSPLQHGQVAIGVSRGEDRATTDVALDAYGLAVFVIIVGDLRKLDERGLAVTKLVFHPASAADDLLRRNAIDALGPRPHELDAATGNDVGFETVRTQIGKQFQHRLIDHLRVEFSGGRVLCGGDPIADDFFKLFRC